MTGDEQRTAIAALQAAGWADDRHVGWGYATEAEVEEALDQLAEVELALHGLDRFPDVALAIAECFADLPVEHRNAIAAFCWLTYAWGWLHHREGLALA